METINKTHRDQPEGWIARTLGEMVERRKGKKPKHLYDSPLENSVPYLDIDAFENHHFKRFAEPAESIVVSKGQPLIVWDGARSGLCGVAPCRGAVGSTIAALSSEALFESFLNLFLKSEYSTLNGHTRGSGIPHVDPEVFNKLLAPVPPYAEQKRIVAKVEMLLERVDEARERLDRIPDILKKFRQSILAAACSGQLTADWRTDNPIKKPHEIIEQIESERPKLYEENNSSRYRAAIDPRIEQEYDYPDEWPVVSLDQLTCLVTSGSRGWAKYYSDEGPLFIRAQNINTDNLVLDDMAHVNPPDTSEGRRTRVKKHDLLITITGANVTKSAVVNSDIGEAYVSQHVSIARPVDARVSAFLFIWLISPAHGRKKLLAEAYGAGKPGLNLTNIRDTPVALPPLEEQTEIVQRVGRLLILADQLERRVCIGNNKAQRLVQSVLANAFEGKLVETEADLARRESQEYETAQALLERISKESEMKKTNKKITTKKKRPSKSDIEPSLEDGSIQMEGMSQHAAKLLKILRTRFGQKKFSPEDLAEVIDNSDEQQRAGLFELLENRNGDTPLQMVYVKSRQIHSYKIRKEE
ncbi:Type-1 restriction enzyme EcoKI specificity protein [Gimesia maris]|uniref:restriction endonuclease subunit S n=1 Tax=Gimesia maris TaxID=122 RepID=UPI001189886E|nr:restriction endonuclease subunit S [Gimesia maris]QDT81997.1 Type-1 restriction enzyme EcoKI specificity protein [Gimesia maris]